MLETLLRCFRSKRREGIDDRRTISLCDPELRSKYPDNEVRSSKYNVLTFLPLNLWEQFHRPINMYFLMVATLQFVPSVAPVSPYTTIFPISVAFLINAVKEGIDDVRRHRQDNERNSRHCTVMDPVTRQWKSVTSKSIHVGDVLLLRPFEVAPCDVVILASSGEHGDVYVSTETLDGETGTKARLAALREFYSAEWFSSPADEPAMTAGSAHAEGVGSSHSSRFSMPLPSQSEMQDVLNFLCETDLVVDSEGPNTFLHSYNATITLTTTPQQRQNSTLNWSSEETRALSGASEYSGNSRIASAHTRSSPRRSQRPIISRNSSNSLSSADEQEPLLSAAGQGYSEPGLVGEPVPRVSIGINVDNVILSSCMVHNTRYALALVVFTGMETKVNMTRDAPPTKWATIDRKFNSMTIAIFAFQLTMLVLYASLSVYSLATHTWWYLGGSAMGTPPEEYFPILPLRYFTMLSPMVPLSFKVMVEISKAYISSVIRWDDDLCSEVDGGEHASVNNSALAEDLGMVEYVLSDKTGTLTANTMTLAAIATADGTVYETQEGSSPTEKEPRRRAKSLVELQESMGSAREVGSDAHSCSALSKGTRRLMEAMVFCNTIERSLMAGATVPPQSRREAHRRRANPQLSVSVEKQWTSCSPDEVALVEGVEWCGVRLLERSRKAAKACFAGAEESVEILKILPFSSTRGRMSVLLRRSGASLLAQDNTATAKHTGKSEFVLLMKGSDEKVLPLCSEGSYAADDVPVDARPAPVLKRFSSRGLRTLVYGFRNVSKQEARDWMQQIQEAEATVTEYARHVAVEKACAAIERDLEYCGCTAVADQLQDGVQHTISCMRNASIHVWMLTGDRAETARQTAIASGLLQPEDHVVSLTLGEAAAQMTTEQLLGSARSDVDHILQNDTCVSETISRALDRPRWRRWVDATGLPDYASEFLTPLSYEYLKPVNHPLKYGHHGGFSPGEVARLTTLREQAVPDTRRGTSQRGYSFMLTGALIDVIYRKADGELRRDFEQLMLNANTVVCSRTAPAQKAIIAQAVKDAGKITLAIGDGGNDVAMIQTAHVGVGIKGKEGSQAALSADFSVSQFRFLAKLLLVHGHTAYQRTAVIVQQSFWKSVLIAWVQLLFNLFTDFSGVSYWDSFSLMLYNALPTVPVTFLCVMDMPLSPWMLTRNPQLYRMSQRGRYLNATTFYGYVLRAIVQGTMIFFMAMGLSWGSNGLLATGWPLDRGGDFYAAYFTVVTVHTYTVLTESHSINYAHWQCFLFSVWSCFLCFGLYAASPFSANPTFHTLLFSPHFYLSYIVMTATVCLSLGAFAAVKVTWFPDALQLQRTGANAARRLSGPYGPLLSALLEDNNPSDFWRSWSPLHACWLHSRARSADDDSVSVSADASPVTVESAE